MRGGATTRRHGSGNRQGEVSVSSAADAARMVLAHQQLPVEGGIPIDTGSFQQSVQP
jgi:hypothetical protein